eukprot:TRINITY_DN46309_c0_g1_i1.p1 TRINITY_DN46309_c0_g1~~TRINITY_DN46309_c0_g1_i1.p1  ORF type:complete len:496 (-),score=72.36 TRINITY_DN46309_c0_g1_i1:328-1815(-)
MDSQFSVPVRFFVLAAACAGAGALQATKPETQRLAFPEVKTQSVFDVSSQLTSHTHLLEVRNSDVLATSSVASPSAAASGASTIIRLAEQKASAVLVTGRTSAAFDTNVTITEERVGFLRVKTARGKDVTRFQVEVASPFTISVVFLTLYLPVAFGWLYYYSTGCDNRVYTLLLPLTLCATLVGDNFIQKSLAVIMSAPMAITSAQAAGMGVVGSIWTVMQMQVQPLTGHDLAYPLAVWGVVALMFTLYQLLNHLVAQYCSLAERTVFTNLCPVVSLLLEATVMPAALKATVSARSKMALSSLVFGAIVFSIQYPDFSTVGMAFASLMVLSVVPYRLAQRYALNASLFMPVMLLVAYDGFFLWVPSTMIASAGHGASHYLQTWDGWLNDPSVQLMLVLSLLTFISNHAFALLLLRLGTATTLQVYQNLSNFAVVFLGIFFFGDNVMSSPLVLLGLTICLLSGLWYALEVQPAAKSEGGSFAAMALDGKRALKSTA